MGVATWGFFTIVENTGFQLHKSEKCIFARLGGPNWRWLVSSEAVSDR